MSAHTFQLFHLTVAQCIFESLTDSDYSLATKTDLDRIMDKYVLLLMHSQLPLSLPSSKTQFNFLVDQKSFGSVVYTSPTNVGLYIYDISTGLFKYYLEENNDCVCRIYSLPCFQCNFFG